MEQVWDNPFKDISLIPYRLIAAGEGANNIEFPDGTKISMKKELKGSVMVESILILVVLIALVAIFKTQLMDLVGEIFEKITSEGLAI